MVMIVTYAVFEGDVITNMIDIDDSIVSWFIPHLATIFPTWELHPLDSLVKRDDGNPNIIWISC